MRPLLPLLLCLCLAGLPLPAEARQGKSLADIQRTGTVTVCADPDNLPFSSRAAPPGYDVEVAQALAAELGARVELEWIGTASARAALRRLTEGDCDLFPGLPLSPGFAEEHPRLAFSEAYYVMKHALVLRAGTPVGGLAALAGVTTAVEALSHGDLFLLEQGHRRRVFRTQQAAFQAVATGETEAALLWAPIAGWLAARGVPSVQLAPISAPGLEVPIGFGVRRDDRSLKPAVDHAVTRLLGAGTVRGILARYGVPALAARAPELPLLPRLVGSPTGTPVLVAWRGGASWSAQAAPRAASPAAKGEDSDVVEGRHIYQENCAQCHGADGLGRGVVPRLQAYPQGADARFVAAVLQGRTALGMPPWGGLLGEGQVRQILKYVQALIPPPEVVSAVGTAREARRVFELVCASCHGRTAAGTSIAPSLQTFRGDDEGFVATVMNGRPGTAMAPFRGVVSSEVARAIRVFVRELTGAN